MSSNTNNLDKIINNRINSYTTDYDLDKLMRLLNISKRSYDNYPVDKFKLEKGKQTYWDLSIPYSIEFDFSVMHPLNSNYYDNKNKCGGGLFFFAADINDFLYYLENGYMASKYDQMAIKVVDLNKLLLLNLHPDESITVGIENPRTISPILNSDDLPREFMIDYSEIDKSYSTSFNPLLELMHLKSIKIWIPSKEFYYDKLYSTILYGDIKDYYDQTVYNYKQRIRMVKRFIPKGILFTEKEYNELKSFLSLNPVLNNLTLKFWPDFIKLIKEKKITEPDSTTNVALYNWLYPTK